MEDDASLGAPKWPRTGLFGNIRHLVQKIESPLKADKM